MTTYDPKCEELARHFLPTGASEDLVSLLALEIQQAIEDWLEFEVPKEALI